MQKQTLPPYPPTTMAAPPPPPHPAVQMDELVEEFLLRLPPEDPAVLARAALVSRQWHRLITGPVFRRRFRELHRSPPLLGYIANLRDSILFVPTSSFRPRHAELRLRDVRAVQSGHGRVLLQHPVGNVLSVWDPVTDEQRHLPNLPLDPGSLKPDWDAAVVCAGGDGCNHIHCHFEVVFVGRSREGAFSCFYSSEADRWSDPIFASGGSNGHFFTGTCVLIGSSLYYLRQSKFDGTGSNEILKYDLPSHQMCTNFLRFRTNMGNVFMVTVDGRLGVLITSNSTLRLWLMDHGGWQESRIIELHRLLPPEAFSGLTRMAGFSETGAGVVFLWTRVGYFTIDLNLGRSKKVGEDLGSGGHIVPYMSFCTPAPGSLCKDEGERDVIAVSTDEGPAAGAAVSTDEEEVAAAGVVVSIDEGPGNGVVVSTDEGPGTGVCQVHKKLKS